MKLFAERAVGSRRLGRRIVLYGALPLLLLAVMGSAPRAEISRSVIDLGVVRRGQFLHELVFVKNEGLRPLKIDSRARTCGVRVHTEASSTTLPHGGATPLRLEIDTTLFPEGASVKEVDIPTNDPLKRSLRVTIRATVRSDVSIAPRFLRLSAQDLTAVARVQITRTSDVEPVSIRTTNPLVNARFHREESPQGSVFIVSARADVDGAVPWDLGTIVIATRSATVPELHIPVRGVLP
ncbi:MAG: hypothetical protein WBC51_21210 [Vicinamibacterales bacterium]